MPSGLSAGKQKGLEAVADPRGIIAAIAIDQRSALEDWLHSTGAQNIQNVNLHLKAAVPWQAARQQTASGRAHV